MKPIRGFKEILQGKHDDLPEEAFLLLVPLMMQLRSLRRKNYEKFEVIGQQGIKYQETIDYAVVMKTKKTR